MGVSPVQRLTAWLNVNDKESKQIMLRIAKDYELAERAGERLKRRKKNNVIEALDDRPSATPVLFGLTPHGRSVRVLALDAVPSISLVRVSGDADGVR